MIAAIIIIAAAIVLLLFLVGWCAVAINAHEEERYKDVPRNARKEEENKR